MGHPDAGRWCARQYLNALRAKYFLLGAAAGVVPFALVFFFS